MFYLKICHFLVVKFSVYLNRRVFVMKCFAYIYWSSINFELKISNNLAHSVNDTLPLKLAVSSKPDRLP